MSIDLPLDEKGFVYLDEANKPFWCTLQKGMPWIYSWNQEKYWVKFRLATLSEIEPLFMNRLSEEHAERYHKQHALNRKRYFRGK